MNMPREPRQSIADGRIGFLKTPGMNEHLRAHVPEIGILGIALAGGFEYLQGFVKLATLFMNTGQLDVCRRVIRMTANEVG